MREEKRVRDSVRLLLGKSLDQNADLRALQEQYQRVLDGIEEGYVEVDLNGTVTLCNRAFAAITGYSPKEIIGVNFRDRVPQDLQRVVFDNYHEVYRSGISNKGFCYEIIGKNNAQIHIENSISLIKDSYGNPKGFRSITRDITRRKRAEKELEMHRTHLQAIFQSVQDAIITIDSCGKLTEANQAAEAICGLCGELNVGKEFSHCSTQCDKNCLESVMNLFRHNPLNVEYKVQCNHHHRREQQVIIRGTPLVTLNGGRPGTVLVIRDITQLHILEEKLKERYQFHTLIGKSHHMQNIYEFLNSLANLETTVLLTGESGTGKSLVAKALHYSGNRAARPMITVNCAALPESLLESELFGHVKGAFTGAIKDTLGRFETASNGTILLDEIGDISPRMQLKLLRVLEEREFERVGESVARKTNARVIASTNQNLKEKVKLGEFREDLYYRLKVVQIEMPSLRERKGDIPLLADHFLDVFRKKFSKNIYDISHEVLGMFMSYSWPGNVRELMHAIEHTFIFCDGPQLQLDHLPLDLREHYNDKRTIHARTAEKEDEKDTILIALETVAWNKAKAARILGIDRTTLYRKIRKYQLSID